MTPREQLEQARAKARRDSAEFEQRNREMMSQAEKDREHRERYILPNLRPASAAEYSRWLRGYLENGGTLGNYSDSPMTGIYVAVRHFDLPPLCGASSISVIVPEGVIVDRQPGFSHNSVFWMDGFRYDGTFSPRAYSDTVL